MRITRAMLENRVNQINNMYEVGLEATYMNGLTWVLQLGEVIYSGTTPQCYSALSVFVRGLYTGLNIASREE